MGEKGQGNDGGWVRWYDLAGTRCLKRPIQYWDTVPAEADTILKPAEADIILDLAACRG